MIGTEILHPVFILAWQSIEPVVTNRRSKLPQSMTVTLDMCPRKCRVIFPALRSKSLTAPPALPLTRKPSVGSKRRLSMAELFPVRLHMLLARPTLHTFTLCLEGYHGVTDSDRAVGLCHYTFRENRRLWISGNSTTLDVMCGKSRFAPTPCALVPVGIFCA